MRSCSPVSSCELVLAKLRKHVGFGEMEDGSILGCAQTAKPVMAVTVDSTEESRSLGSGTCFGCSGQSTAICLRLSWRSHAARPHLL